VLRCDHGVEVREVRPRLLPREIGASADHGWPQLRPTWQPVPSAWLVTVTLLFVWLVVALWLDDDGYLLGLDSLNLIVHEAGHFLFVWFGETLELYGGTLLQLAVPLLIAATFARRGEAQGVALAGIWFFQNFLNVARYMADARVQLLPLVGGGGHDWYAILSRWHLLRYDTRLAGLLRAAGWAGMFASYAWLVWRWRRDQRSARAVTEEVA
jgi:hypothetical protein